MDTLAERYGLLKPHMTWYGPDHEAPLPVFVLFHGCGGLRPHVHDYARAIAGPGCRALVVDSFTPRGWNRTFAVSLICTGVVLQGYERAGDVLAVLWGLRRERRVDVGNLILGGFSHGGWAITDLMCAPLSKSGEVRIADPDPALVEGLKGLCLVYPYVAFPAQTRHHPWLRTPDTLWVVATQDHLTRAVAAHHLIDKLSAQGINVTKLDLDATHAFDEEGGGGMMHYSAEAKAESIAAVKAFVTERFGLTEARAS